MRRAAGVAPTGASRLHGSSGSGEVSAAIDVARAARSTSRASNDTQSSERHAGTTPRLLMQPRVGLSPTMPLHAAGTRPDPAVSVPIAKSTSPRATATADPELEPPDTRPGQ